VRYVLLSEAVEESEWEMSWGGFESVADREDNEGELLTMFPQNNCLNVLVTEPGVCTFRKYLSHGAPADIVDFSLSFRLGAAIEALQMDISSVDDDDDDEDEDEEGEGAGEEEGMEQAQKKQKN
jgi:hypothetical protein